MYFKGFRSCVESRLIVGYNCSLGCPCDCILTVSDLRNTKYVMLAKSIRLTNFPEGI